MLDSQKPEAARYGRLRCFEGFVRSSLTVLNCSSVGFQNQDPQNVSLSYPDLGPLLIFVVDLVLQTCIPLTIFSSLSKLVPLPFPYREDYGLLGDIEELTY